MKNWYLILLSLLACLIMVSFLYTSFFAKELPVEFQQLINRQQNPFVVHKDCAALVWKRAGNFFEERKGTITGGTLRHNDSMYYLPYYNDYHKGSSIKILKRAKGDSFEIETWWWYNGDTSDSEANEIALYLQTGIDRYNFKIRMP